MPRYGKVAIIGVGLIGGSIGLALRKKRLAREVIGVGHHVLSIRKAVKKETIHWGTLDLRRGVAEADIVILATPVLTIPKLIKKIAKYLKKGSIITDVGSVKACVVKKTEKVLPRGVSFVGAHPMAGSEKRGVDKARPDLFRNSVCILTATPKTNHKALNTVRRLWKDLGAKTVMLPAGAHDRIVAEISHLPHMVVFALLNSVNENSLKFASSGLQDTTRIASSDARIWRDIAISNKAEVLKSIAKFKRNLSILEKAIRKEKAEKLLSIFTRAKNKREKIDHCN